MDRGKKYFSCGIISKPETPATYPHNLLDFFPECPCVKCDAVFPVDRYDAIICVATHEGLVSVWTGIRKLCQCGHVSVDRDEELICLCNQF